MRLAQDFSIPNRNPGRVGRLTRLIKAADAQFLADNAAASVQAVCIEVLAHSRSAFIQVVDDVKTGSYTYFLEKMKEEPRKAHLSGTPSPFLSLDSWLAGAC